MSRGDEAMAVRDPLPLALPEDAVQAASSRPPRATRLRLAERGPEITEIQ